MNRTAQAVRFDRYGDRDVLYVTDVPMPEPGPGEVVVEVRAAGINPFDTMIRSGVIRDLFPVDFPSGQGSDLAGVVVAVGAGVDGLAVGDEVLGWTPVAGTQATHAAVPADRLVAKPPQVSWEAAGSLHMVGATAYAAVRAVAPQPGETVAVSAAAGGVGSFLVQMLTARGVRVLGIASSANAEWLDKHGVIPVSYGEGLRERLQQAAGAGGIEAFIDLYGPEYLDLAVALGIKPDRIQTTVAMERAAEIGAKTDGRHNATAREILVELVDLVASGAVELPIAATYPLDRVADAFGELEQRHTRGKIVLIP
ncbi:NADP-dependent oxidoreductase [Streptomyces himalayensis]|uniref:NADP-dependent oxidoreductase n=1 Tax=Streptomyces himalayensis subsp. himalayensis TaxID=2756131 RepID=A0A7W0DUY8_9ACTN|nr:NADP-dependent oxidoreductase [Streptomyces himalayensis]MBA2951360.1 NADP-dependent oxidoreductase [Streptomyces himalayensis subsp. himalayensis]